MSQNAERQEAIRKIRKLVTQTLENGRTEHEANLAMEHVTRLRETFNINMDEIDLRDEPCIETVITIQYKNRQPIDGIVNSIAKFCDCIAWRSKDRHGAKYHFFGLESDAQMAQFLFTVINSAVNAETAKFKLSAEYIKFPSHRRKASHSFQMGMVMRLRARLRKMKEEMDSKIIAERPTGNGLMILKNQKVIDAFEARDLKLVKCQSSPTISSGSSFSSGNTAGDRVNLSRPIASGPSGMRLLGHG